MKNIVIVIMLLFIVSTVVFSTPRTTATPALINAAAGKTVSVSSSFSADFPPSNITDGNAATVWGTEHSITNQWFYIDLERMTDIQGLRIHWFDTYYAKAYDIALSNDLKTWNFVFKTTKGTAGTTELIAGTTVPCRYIGVLLKSSPNGIYAVSEFEVLAPDFENEYKRSLFSIFDQIPNQVAGDAAPGLTFSRQFTPGTQWTAPNLDPLNVYHATLNHSQSTGGNDWEMRIGKGGQIYSLRTAAGELIPPQEHEGAEWIDEVFQAIAVNTELNNRDYMVTRYFIHQSGTYWQKPGVGALDPDYLNHSWYSPMLTDYYNKEENAYYSLVWGQLSHVPAIFKSGVLFYTKIKDMGGGVIELSYVIKNDGEDKINWLNVPWGGVRQSSLPVQIMSKPDGSYEKHARYFGQVNTPAQPDDMGIYDFDQTGGWFAWTQGETTDSLGLALVFGTDKYYQQPGYEGEWRKAHFKWGATKSTLRDYNVGSVIMPFTIEPGNAFYYKSYMILGTLGEIRDKAAVLKDAVEYGLFNCTEVGSPMVPLRITTTNNRQELTFCSDTSASLYTYAYPVKNALPLYVMKNTATGDTFISFDPYQRTSSIPFTNPCVPGDKFYELYQNRVQYRPYDGNTEYHRFLGYALPANQVSPVLSYDYLSGLVTDTIYYPTPSQAHKDIMVRTK